MGQESSQEKAHTGEADTAHDMFSQIADAMDASQNRRKSQLLQANSPGVAQEDPMARKSKKERRKERRKEKKSRQLRTEMTADTESMDVIPESSPTVGSKRKIKTFKSAQKKRIPLGQMDGQDAGAIPPTQPSQDAHMADTRESPSGSLSMSDDGHADKDKEVETEQQEEPEVVVKPNRSQKSKAEKKQKRRLPVEDVMDTPSKRARLDFQKKSKKERRKEPASAAMTPAAEALQTEVDDEKHGMLSKEEWDAIDMQLEKYRAMKEMTVEEQNRVIHQPVSGKDSPANQLFTWVMEEIHRRRRWSVIHAMRRKYHNFDKRGAWAPEDDEELMALQKRYPAQWKEIGSRLNRHPDDCRDRYRYVLVCGTNIHWGWWSLDEEQLLQKVVEDSLRDINAARQEQTADLDAKERAKFYEDAPADKDLIDWDEISARMGRRRGPRQCSEKYKKIQKRTPARWAYYAKQEGQAVIQASKMKLNDKVNLLRILQEADVAVEDEILWDDVAHKLIELDSEGNIAKLTPKFSPKSARKAWTKLKYLLENENSLEFQEIVDTLLDKLNKSGDEDPSAELFQPRIGGLDVHQRVRKDLKPAKRTKHNVIVAATMTVEEKRHLLTKLQKSGAAKEDDVVWPEIFPASRGVLRKFEGGWEAKKLGWELLSSFLETPGGFQGRVSLLIEKLDSADGQDPTKELFMELVEKKSLQDDLKKWEERKSTSAKEEATEKAAKEKIAKMPASAKLKVLEALSKSGVKDEKDIIWTKHGHLPYMKKSTYNAHAQNVMLQELKATVDKVEDYDFQGLIDHLITKLSGSTKEEGANSARRSTNKSSKLSKKVLEEFESDDEVDKDVVESLNAAVVQTPTSQSSSSAENPTERSLSSPVLRKDLYDFDEDEMEETMLKSAMKKRKTPKTIQPSHPPPSSPPPTLAEKKIGKKETREKRRSEIAETQEEETTGTRDISSVLEDTADAPTATLQSGELSALDLLVSLGSPKIASPPKGSAQDAIPPTSSLMPTMSQVIKQSKKNKKNRHSDIAFVAPLPEIPAPSPEEPLSNLAESLRKAKRGKREAETSVEQLEAQEEDALEAPATGRKMPRVSVPMFTPRASKRERRPTEKAMTPYK